MPKHDTLLIQTRLKELGEKLGFISVMEERPHERIHYAPVYDVVWYLDMEKHFSLNSLKELFKNDPVLFERVKKLPFAGFEIEGASTSSKNQISNFANLYSGNFLYNFVIVNNSEANGENDTYRRGLKIKHYFADNSGDRNVFFFDYTHLIKSVNQLTCFENVITTAPKNSSARKNFGGDTTSVSMYEKIHDYIDDTGLTVLQNYTPWIYKVKHEMLKNTSKGVDVYTDFFLRQSFYKDPCSDEISTAKAPKDNFYMPKLDTVLGFNAPKGFVAWMDSLANAVGNDYVHFPILYALKSKMAKTIFIPLISIEFEYSINKHLNGGIYNMSKNSYVGVLVTEESAKAHTDFFKHELGIKNVTAYSLEG